jgi:hypothetical protein
MTLTLNITNGDSAVELMSQGGIEGEILPWRDVLHEGPVPAHLSLDELSLVRGEFLSSIGWISADNAKKAFTSRDNILKSFSNFEKVVLWFEHDLYDQLQILQILDWFSCVAEIEAVQLSMICTDNYLGFCTPEEINELQEFERPVENDQLSLAKKAWARFREPEPSNWNQLLNEDTSALPFLHGAVERHLEEFPDVRTGLSRTASTLMRIVENNDYHGAKIFQEQQKTEERIFMGDLSFWKILGELINSPLPLIKAKLDTEKFDPRNENDTLALTAMGKRVLDGERNWMDKHRIDKWLGGVYLNANNVWFWNPEIKKVVRANE